MIDYELARCDLIDGVRGDGDCANPNQAQNQGSSVLSSDAKQSVLNICA
jgi:hypothetical protein